MTQGVAKVKCTKTTDLCSQLKYGSHMEQLIFSLSPNSSKRAPPDLEPWFFGERTSVVLVSADPWFW